LAAPLVARSQAKAKSRARIAAKINRTIHRQMFIHTCPYFYALKRNDVKLNRYLALASFLSMIFSENRHPLFRIMLETIANQMVARACARVIA
jgi:hypothetical protein